LDLTNTDLQLRSNFQTGLTGGTIFTNAGTGTQLANHFFTGGGGDLMFPNGSPIANEIGGDPRFLDIVRNFENQALAFYRANGNLDGFSATMNLPDFGGIRNNLFLATAMGGSQGIRAEIRLINSREIQVNYTIYDVFGAGRNDAGRWQFPGLQSMYVLQHYRNVDEDSRNQYQPYFWGVNINRRRTPSR
jgi:hypothetical protein